jgi:hypothetical protein
VRVDRVHRLIPHVPVQVRVSARETNWVLTQPAARTTIVPTVEIVLQTGGRVEPAAGEREGLIDVLGVTVSRFSVKWNCLSRALAS